MKKLVPLIFVICLLASSCRPGEFPRTDVESASDPKPPENGFEYSAGENVAGSAPSVSPRFFTLFGTSEPGSGLVPSVSSAPFRVNASGAAEPTAQTFARTSIPARVASARATEEPRSSPRLGEKELRGVWISCYDHICAAGKTRAEYKAETDEIFKTISEAGLNAAFVHLRAFSDAFYESELYPYSSFIAGTEGASLPFDPFRVVLESADKYKISVHGWINPFRISLNNDPSSLSDKNPAKKILDAGDPKGEIVVLKNGIYYNPSLASNHKRILDGVREILNKYDVAGIHIDDYFYPSADVSIDKKQYEEYKEKGGVLGIADWRRSCINAFVSGLYSTVKAFDPKLIVGVSPSAQIRKNASELYADCRLWLSRAGYADVIVPQLYFGFEHEKLDFLSLLNEWASLPRSPSVSLACGLAAYKCGGRDPYAGAGASEWIENSDILARQLEAVRKRPDYGGFAVFSYKDLIRGSCKTEIQNFKKVVLSNGE